MSEFGNYFASCITFPQVASWNHELSISIFKNCSKGYFSKLCELFKVQFISISHCDIFKELKFQ